MQRYTEENLFEKFWKTRNEKIVSFVILKLRLPIADDPRFDVVKNYPSNGDPFVQSSEDSNPRAARPVTFESIDTMINDVGWDSDKLNLSWNAREFILESVRYAWEYQLSAENIYESFWDIENLFGQSSLLLLMYNSSSTRIVLKI